MATNSRAGIANVVPPTFALEPFDKIKTKWSRWVKRFEGALEIFGVPVASRKNLILHYMGTETYNILCDHIAPTEPECKTYEEIVTVLGEYFDPEPLEMVELWKFRHLKQLENQSVLEYATMLQRESKYCKFEDYLQKGLRNQFVFGLQNERIKARLIEERDLTFEKAKQVAVSMEISGEGASLLNRKFQELNLTEKAEEVDHVTQRGRREQITNTCYRCGKEGHLANRCVHIGTYCRGCNRKGHLKKVCMRQGASFKKESSQYKSQNKPFKKYHTNMIEDEAEQKLQDYDDEDYDDQHCDDDTGYGDSQPRTSNATPTL
ncbi:uncharacterized protein LOC129752868 [Uranotaenia lowii]|uniref:uncharacterized protein LOC129752868 n=1 Tax=Uranotaenia lowii TaxID=190385 RepID=UPI00247A6346|nr:uncharacterized protein LOC129752868 [Uranotaenia lowii]